MLELIAAELDTMEACYGCGPPPYAAGKLAAKYAFLKVYLYSATCAPENTLLELEYVTGIDGIV